jgi:hypothetical protein
MLIAVLGIILAAVLIVQFGGASSAPESGVPAAGKSEASKAGAPAIGASPTTLAGTTAVSGAASPAARAGAAAPASAGQGSASRTWPRLDAQAAAAYDPFTMPAPMALKLAAEQHASQASKPGEADPRQAKAALASLRSKGISAVLRNQSSAVAVIGNREVRVGDVIEGYRVVSIEADGVLLAPSEPARNREERK